MLFRLLIEITRDEPVLRPVEHRSILHEYGEDLEATIQSYAIDEIVAEKLRALLQHLERLKARGWGRSRARDYYDLWRVLGTYPDHIDPGTFGELLSNKCALRGVGFSTADDFFEESLLDHVGRTWTQWLGPLVPDLPAFEKVIVGLRPKVDRLLRPQ